MDREKLFLEVINNLNEGIYFVDLNRKIRFWNKAAEVITGYSAEEATGTYCADNFLKHIDGEGRPLCLVSCPLYDTMVDGKQRRARVFARHKEGYRIPLFINVLPIYEDGKIKGAIEIFSKESLTVYEDHLIENLASVATHDPLTELPNRRYLEDFIHYKLGEYSLLGQNFALLFADIDDFKHFNNTYGHEVGDTILRNIAETIAHNTRSNDLVGRWGGEEFVGIYSISYPEEAKLLGEKFLNLIRSTDVTYEGENLGVTVSIGVAVVTSGDTEDSLVERADHLMYMSKESGKNRVTVQEDL